MSKIISWIAVGVVLMSCCIAAWAKLPEQVVPQMLGVNIHFSGSNDKEIEQISQAGFKFIRDDFFWSHVEKAKGSYDYSAFDGLMDSLTSKGIRPIFILDYSNELYDGGQPPSTTEGRAAFAAFAGAAAAHYKGRGVIWEIWNEPNDGFWPPKPNAENYTALVKEAYSAIKAADPDATVIGPAASGMGSTFLENCLQLGLLQSLDAVSVHPYRKGPPETVMADYDKLRGMISRYSPKGKQIPIISSEWGYSTAEQSEEQQAQYIARMFLANLMAGIPLSIWYDWRDDGTEPNNRERHFGTVYQDFTPKPSYTAIQTLTKELDGCKFVRRIGDKEDEFILLFKGPQGYRLAAWTTGVERELMLPLDVDKVKLVSMSGEESDAPITDGKLTIKLSQSPVYVDAGTSERLALEEGIEIKREVTNKWHFQDIVTATISNPLSHQIKGSITLQVPGQKKPAKSKFSAAPGKGDTVKFEPKVIWDGRSDLAAMATITFDGMDTPITRAVDLGTSDRIVARPTCPINKILEFKILSPAGYKITGKLNISDVKGLKLKPTKVKFTVDNQTVLALSLNEPAPKEFSFSYQVVDFAGHELMRTPIQDYTIQEDFSGSTPDLPINGYKVILEGDENVQAKVEALGARRDVEYVAIPPIPACRIKYDFDSGQRFARLVPENETLLPQNALEVGMWIEGDGSGNTVRCRFVDSNGQTFQTSGFPLNWKGWRYRTMLLSGPSITFWGGPADGKPQPPLKWDTIFLLDPEGKRSQGLVHIGPIMVVSGL